MSSPKLSVIVTTYDRDRYTDFISCIQSLYNQSYSNLEVVLVIEDEEMYSQAQAELSNGKETQFIHSEPGGLAKARNIGAEEATGEILAFVDDDCIVSPGWASAVATAYVEQDAIGTGGPCIPLWPTDSGRPSRIPTEFGWLVGVTNPEFDTPGETRNAYGCNLSIKKEIFMELDGFDTQLGKDHKKNLQAEDADLCTRMQAKYGQGVHFLNDAKVHHKVYQEQLTRKWLWNRAYLQGYTKFVFSSKGNEVSTEQSYLKYLYLSAIPNRLRNIVSGDGTTTLIEILYIFWYTFLVGLGFLTGAVHQKIYRNET